MCRIACLSNTAQCHMNVGAWDAAIAVTTSVLEMAPGHAKCLFRRGASHSQRRDYEAALRDLLAAQAMDPSDGNIVAMVAEVRSRVLVQEELLKAKMRGMFS